MKLIDKDALAAEIDNMLNTKEHTSHSDQVTFNSGRWKALKKVKDILDTLKVKEVDLEEEIERVRKTHFINDDFEKATLEGRQITNIAEHFFELGLKAQKGE